MDRVFKRMRDDPEITNYVLVKNILKRKIINKSKDMTLRFQILPFTAKSNESIFVTIV